MKRMLCIVMTMALLLCGCQRAEGLPDETRQQTEAVTENVTEAQVDVLETEAPGVSLPVTEQQTGIAIGATGCVRVPYTGNVSSVRYVTGVEQLPDNEALAAYDAAYFENNALIVVLETVSSGSVQVGIESVDDGAVTLSHVLPGDAGTADMATWLLWAEVEAGLDCTWSVVNPGFESNAVTH